LDFERRPTQNPFPHFGGHPAHHALRFALRIESYLGSNLAVKVYRERQKIDCAIAPKAVDEHAVE
jgi:hypothetical protein